MRPKDSPQLLQSLGTGTAAGWADRAGGSQTEQEGVRQNRRGVRQTTRGSGCAFPIPSLPGVFSCPLSPHRTPIQLSITLPTITSLSQLLLQAPGVSPCRGSRWTLVWTQICHHGESRDLQVERNIHSPCAFSLLKNTAWCFK